MYEMPEIVRIAKDAVQHATARQAEIAKNVANADTPGYRARDVQPFEDHLQGTGAMRAKTTRDGHLPGLDPQERFFVTVDQNAEPAPNGNSVSIETEILKSSEVSQSHGLAVAVYKTSLDLMRTALGRSR